MNMHDFVGVDSYLRDKATGEQIEWHDYMNRVIEKLGIQNIKSYIPYNDNIDYLREMVKKDEYLNNIPLHLWDKHGGFITPFLVRNGITILSQSEKVCVLKEAAIKLTKEE